MSDKTKFSYLSSYKTTNSKQVRMSVMAEGVVPWVNHRIEEGLDGIGVFFFLKL